MQVNNVTHRVTHNLIRGLILLLSFMVVSLSYAETNISPVGNWTTMDPYSKKSKEVIQITEDENHMLTGKIIKVFDPTQNRTMCETCPEEFKNKPLVGMEVLWGVTQATKYTWNNGRMLNPRIGRVFSCNLTVSQDGQTITNRIYGNSGLVRTQIWYRAA